MIEADLYQGREQTLIKHFVFQRYFERFAHIVGTWVDSITYVDCFSGPWNERSEELQDSSFAIALGELKRARDTLEKTKKKRLGIRCFFIEKDPDAFAKLETFAAAHRASDISIETRHSTFEEVVPEVERFVRAAPKTFPFIFIDPKGWTGFAMDTISPLLRLDPGEVLVNFQTFHIQRWLESPEKETVESFARLFGDPDFKTKIEGMASRIREDAAIDVYAANLKRRGGYRYVCRAVVLQPLKDQVHYHLVYGTRHPKGVEVFKEAEKKAASVMEGARAEARKRKVEDITGQTSLFAAETAYGSDHYKMLRDRYLVRGKGNLEALLEMEKKVPYDLVWEVFSEWPLVWDADIKEWLREWAKAGLLRMEFPKGGRVPQRNRGDMLHWTGSR